MRNVALDLGVREISYCEVLQGKVVCRRTVRELEQLKDLLAKGEPATVAIEACREAWHVHETLTAWGNTVLLVDTTRARRVGVGEHGRKNDRIERSTTRVPSSAEAFPSLIFCRRSDVSSASSSPFDGRSLKREHNTSPRSAASSAHVGRNFRVATVRNSFETLATQLDPKTRAMFAPVENALAVIDEQVARADVALDEVCGKEAMVRRLATAPGVGLIVAAAFVSVIDEAKRFNNAHQVESYLGLVPSEETTGGRNRRRLGAITKNGNPYTRTLLIQANGRFFGAAILTIHSRGGAMLS